MDTWIHCGKCYQLVNSQIKMHQLLWQLRLWQLPPTSHTLLPWFHQLPDRVALNNKMPKNVQNLPEFWDVPRGLLAFNVDPEEHLKNVAKTIDFQNRQRANYLSYCRNEYMKIVYEATRVNNRLEELDREVAEKTAR